MQKDGGDDHTITAQLIGEEFGCLTFFRRVAGGRSDQCGVTCTVTGDDDDQTVTSVLIGEQDLILADLTGIAGGGLKDGRIQGPEGQVSDHQAVATSQVDQQIFIGPTFGLQAPSGFIAFSITQANHLKGRVQWVDQHVGCQLQNRPACLFTRGQAIAGDLDGLGCIKQYSFAIPAIHSRPHQRLATRRCLDDQVDGSAGICIEADHRFLSLTDRIPDQGQLDIGQDEHLDRIRCRAAQVIRHGYRILPGVGHRDLFGRLIGRPQIFRIRYSGFQQGHIPLAYGDGLTQVDDQVRIDVHRYGGYSNIRFISIHQRELYLDGPVTSDQGIAIILVPDGQDGIAKISHRRPAGIGQGQLVRTGSADGDIVGSQ